MRLLLLTVFAFCLLASAAGAEDRVSWDPQNRPQGERYFDTKHDESFAYQALQELSGQQPNPGSSRQEIARAVLTELSKLPRYGQKETANIKPPIPQWFLDGYSRFQPTTVARSRYLDGVLGGTFGANADTGALYAFWCVYDAEWFSVSRQADYKAWLSTVMLTFPPQWVALKGESAQSLHARLVAPLQTKDEPLREIDNWIKAFTKEDSAFAKPKVRDALVDELLANGGLEADTRMFEDKAYSGPTPGSLSLSQHQFFLLAALTMEYYQEIYEQEPGTKQPLYFRDYFLGVFNSLR
jgi:hypothetical protein